MNLENKGSLKLVSWKERISYGLGDTASNLVFMMITFYLLYFYTDVFGISAAAVATMFLIARVWDAINDLIMGIIIDKTKTKWGKCRPYFLWMAIPYGIFAFLTFTTPDLVGTSKLIYAYITYIALGTVYTAINIPLSAILPSLTDDYQERTAVNAVRMIFAVIGGLLVAGLTMPLVEAFGQGNAAKGFQLTMGLYAVIAVILFIITFLNTRERIQAANKKSIPVKESFKALKGNTPWLISVLINFVMWTGMTMKNQTAIYYLQYNLGRPDLISTFLPLAIIAILPGIILVPFVSKRIGKRNTMFIGNLVAILGFIMIYLAGNHNISLLFTGNIVSSIGLGFNVGLIFALIADTVDYGEWKSGVRASGLLFAASSFGVKLGMGVGGAISGWTLSAGNYIPQASNQEITALTAIKINFIGAPIISAVGILVLLLFYRLDKQYDEIHAELLIRRDNESIA